MGAAKMAVMGRQMRWRVIKNPGVFAPWRDAVGIEEDEESLALAIVCWFTRGWTDSLAMAQDVVDSHNAKLEWKVRRIR